MARIPLANIDELEEPTRSVVVGHPINLYRTLAHNAAGFSCFAAVGEWIRYGSSIDARQREMLILAVGVIDQSEYEFSHHVKIGRDFGLDDRDIVNVLDQVRDGRSDLRDVDALLVESARQITESRGLTDEAWTELAERFSIPELVEIVLIAGHYAAVTRVLGALQVEVERDYLGYLREFPMTSTRAADEPS